MLRGPPKEFKTGQMQPKGSIWPYITDVNHLQKSIFTPNTSMLISLQVLTPTPVKILRWTPIDTSPYTIPKTNPCSLRALCKNTVQPRRFEEGRLEQFPRSVGTGLRGILIKLRKPQPITVKKNIRKRKLVVWGDIDVNKETNKYIS